MPLNWGVSKCLTTSIFAVLVVSLLRSAIRSILLGGIADCGQRMRSTREYETRNSPPQRRQLIPVPGGVDVDFNKGRPFMGEGSRYGRGMIVVGLNRPRLATERPCDADKIEHIINNHFENRFNLHIATPFHNWIMLSRTQRNLFG